VEWLAAAIEREGPPGGRIGILGLTYKPQTDVVEQAVGLLLADELASRNFRVVAYDPAGMVNAQRALGDRVDFAASAEECIGQSDVVVVATPWKEFAEIPPAGWRAPIGARVVIDCWRGLKHIENAEGVRYVSLGLGAHAGRIASAK
jgi:UDPglucose 6-dehydrogenase